MTLAYAQRAGTRTTTTTTDPLLNSQVHTYDDTGALIQMTDEAGNALAVGVDQEQRLARAGTLQEAGEAVEEAEAGGFRGQRSGRGGFGQAVL